MSSRAHHRCEVEREVLGSQGHTCLFEAVSSAACVPSGGRRRVSSLISLGDLLARRLAPRLGQTIYLSIYLDSATWAPAPHTLCGGRKKTLWWPRCMRWPAPPTLGLREGGRVARQDAARAESDPPPTGGGGVRPARRSGGRCAAREGGGAALGRSASAAQPPGLSGSTEGSEKPEPPGPTRLSRCAAPTLAV